MAKTPPSLDNVDLDALDAFLLSDGAPENSMGLSDLDGFLTGVIVGPELLMPSGWMPALWGGGEPDFKNVEEAEAILGTIIARYNEIVSDLDAGIDAFRPIFWEGPSGELIVTDWAAGFIDAIKLRPKRWEPLIQHPDARVLLMPLLVLGADDPDHSPFGSHVLPDDEVEALLEQGAEIIPKCVFAIRDFWREQIGGTGPAPPRSGRRPGGRARR